MAVVGADNQAVLRAVLEDVRQVVVGLAGDVEAVAAEQVLFEIDGKKRAAKFFGFEVGIEEGYPRRAGLDESATSVSGRSVRA